MTLFSKLREAAGHACEGARDKLRSFTRSKVAKTLGAVGLVASFGLGATQASAATPDISDLGSSTPDCVTVTPDSSHRAGVGAFFGIPGQDFLNGSRVLAECTPDGTVRVVSPEEYTNTLQPGKSFAVLPGDAATSAAAAQAAPAVTVPESITVSAAQRGHPAWRIAAAHIPEITSYTDFAERGIQFFNPDGSAQDPTKLQIGTTYTLEQARGDAPPIEMQQVETQAGVNAPAADAPTETPAIETQAGADTTAIVAENNAPLPTPKPDAPQRGNLNTVTEESNETTLAHIPATFEESPARHALDAAREQQEQDFARLGVRPEGLLDLLREIESSNAIPEKIREASARGLSPAAAARHVIQLALGDGGAASGTLHYHLGRHAEEVAELRERFPGIDVTLRYLSGPELTRFLEQEFRTAQEAGFGPDATADYITGRLAHVDSRFDSGLTYAAKTHDLYTRIRASLRRGNTLEQAVTRALLAHNHPAAAARATLPANHPYLAKVRDAMRSSGLQEELRRRTQTPVAANDNARETLRLVHDAEQAGRLTGEKRAEIARLLRELALTQERAAA